MDEEILNTVHSIFGKGVKIIDCEKTSSVQEEEVLLINGVQVKLDAMASDDAAAIKAALLEGQMPSVDLLNQLLYQAGLAQQPIQLETSLSVKSSLITTEEVCVSRHGKILDERSSKTKEDYIYQSNKKEVLQPLLTNDLKKLTGVKMKDRKANDERQQTRSYQSDSNSTITSSSDDIGIADVPSTISNCSTCTFSNETSTASDTSSRSSVVANESQTMFKSNYNIAKNLQTTSSGFSTEKSILSCDSGHDGIFPSVSQSEAWPQWHREINGCNSLASLCYDDASSIEESESTKITDKTFFQDKSDCIYEYRFPQFTSITHEKNTPIDKSQALVYCNEKLFSGTLDTLIAHLVPRGDYVPDNAFQFTLLLCARLFLQPNEMLAKISLIWELQLSDTKIQNAKNLQSTQNLIQLLNQWYELFPNDFHNERSMHEMSLLSKKCVNSFSTLECEVSGFMQKLNIIPTCDEPDATLPAATTCGNSKSTKTESQPQKNNSFYMNFINSSLLQVQQTLSMANVTKEPLLIDICSSALQLAQQLTAIELEHLSHIRPEEFVQIYAKDFTNLEAYVRWFNRLSYIAATDIVKCSKKKQRVNVVRFWIETALECFNIGNFNSLMAILGGLNLVAVSRLKKTWSKVKSAKLSILEHQMDPTSNFSSYRSTLKAAVWRSERATDKRERIVIPLFTLFLKDLFFLNESCSTRLPNNHVNFEKCSHIAKQVQDFNKWKQVGCPYENQPNVIMFLQSSVVFNEEALTMASFACESPDNSDEKGRYKMLAKVLPKVKHSSIEISNM